MPGPNRRFFKKGGWRKKKAKPQPKKSEESVEESINGDNEEGSVRKKVRWESSGVDEEMGHETVSGEEDSENIDIQISDEKVRAPQKLKVLS